MVSLRAALQGVKQRIVEVLSRPVIELACSRHGHTWRSGPLDPPNTVQLFVRQVVEGNVAGTEVVRLAGGRFSDPAWCQARQRLPLAVLRDLGEQVRDRLREAYPAKQGFLWLDRHPVALIDGSNFSMPDTPDLRKYFGDVPGQKPGCGFPIAHWLAVFDFHTGVLLYDEASAYRTPDLKHTPEAHGVLEKGTVVLGDDSFAGYVHLAMVIQRGLHGIFPSHHARTVEFKPRGQSAKAASEDAATSKRIKTLGHNDQIVEMTKPKARPNWVSKEFFDALPETIQVREIRRTVRRKGFRPRQVTVTTTLLDPADYPAAEIVALRERRWDVETDIRHLKTTMGMEVLRSQTAQGVLKELAVFSIVYNLVRGVMLESGRRQRVSPLRLSFADALAWVCHAEEDHEWPELKVVPLRPGRVEPRVVKRRPKPFKLMNRPRDELRREVREKLGARM
jgi:hypothetical protein